MKTKFFNFDDLFGKRKPEITLNSNLPVPQEVKALTEEIKKVHPALESLVRISRKIPVPNKELDIALLVDGKPCNFHFQDNFLPDLLSKQGITPDNLPVERIPKEDLVASVEMMLRQIYKVEDTDVLGAIWSPHHAAAMKPAEILEKARDMDRRSISKAIARLLADYR